MRFLNLGYHLDSNPKTQSIENQTFVMGISSVDQKLAIRNRISLNLLSLPGSVENERSNAVFV